LTSHCEQSTILNQPIAIVRAGDGIRTHDLLLGKETYYHCTTPAGGPDFRPSAESQDRTGDTAIFSRVLYQLSYLGLEMNCFGSGRILHVEREIVKQRQNNLLQGFYIRFISSLRKEPKIQLQTKIKKEMTRC
jgi:hypothetical protein